MTFTYDDVCERIGTECVLNSIFLYYENGNAEMGGPIILNDATDAKCFPFYVNSKTGRHILFNTVLGKMDYEINDSGVRIKSAYSTLSILSLLSSYKYEPYVLEFEGNLIKYVREYQIDSNILKNKQTIDGQDPFVNFHIFTGRSVEDEVDRISRIDNLTRFLLLMGVLLIFLYTLFNNVTSVLYRSKPLCATMGIICGFLGYLSGSGFLFFLGIKFVPPAETVPFLVIGVGVDDIFVILNSYSLLFMIKDHKKRIQICLKDSALAITVTTLTNIIAFLISAFSPFYSICSFSLYTASSLFFCYILVLTFFLSFLCIEAKLETQKKSICSCTIRFFSSCIRRKEEEEENVQENTLSIPYKSNDTIDKKYIDYENVTIYEWIHNLYLFKESINKNKKNKLPALPDERDINNRRDKLNQDIISHKNDTEDISELEKGPQSEQMSKNNSSKKKLFESYDYTEKNCNEEVIENKIDDRIINEGRVINEVIEERERNSNDNAQFIEIKETNEDKEVPSDNLLKEESKENENENEKNKENENENKNNISDNFVWKGKTNKIKNNKIDIQEKEIDEKETGEKSLGKMSRETKDCAKGSINESTCNFNNSVEGTKDTYKNSRNYTNKQVYLLSSHDNAVFYEYIYKEPKGNIGKYFRIIVKNYYVPMLSSTIGKIIVYILFTFIIGFAIYGCTLIKKGIKFNNAFPTDSYVRQFNNAMLKYFLDYGDSIEVYYFDENFLNKYRKLKDDFSHEQSFIFYPEYIEDLTEDKKKVNRNIPWEKKELHKSIYKMDSTLNKLDFISLTQNGLIHFLRNANEDFSNNPKEFHRSFVDWLQTRTEGISFKNDFIFLNEKLVAWRFNYFQKNTEDTEIFGKWLKLCKENSKLDDFNMRMICFHFSSIFIEADESIIEVTAKHLGITIVTVLIVTAYIVKGLYSCVIITVIIFLIDLCIFGFMCLCQITINIISMVILVLSVGFSIDHTSHIVQAFTHSHGRTRNEKMKESLHLMVSPVLHSGLSTWFVISTLFFSNKDFTVIFFQTLSLVLLFSIIFSSIFLPVLLSSIGPM